MVMGISQNDSTRDLDDLICNIQSNKIKYIRLHSLI